VVFHGGDGFAEPGGRKAFQEISPPFSTGVEKVVEMTRSWCRKPGEGDAGAERPHPLLPHAIVNLVISTKVFE
jgi:hypothetical protein